MQYVQFGNTDLKVSKLCLGSMMFSRKIDADGTRAVIDEAIANGINFIDTAESYGDSEDYIGRALEGRRDNVIVASKVYTQRAGKEHGRNSKANIELSLDRSLKLLRTGHLDLYQLHHPDAQTPLDETLATLDAAVKKGKTRYIGVTNHYAWQCATMIERAKRLGFDPIVSLQFRYNILDRIVEVESINMAKRFNLATMAYAPLCGGMLTGKYRRGETSKHGTRSEQDQKLQRLLANDNAFDVIDGLKTIASQENVELNQLAMLWLMSKDGLTTPILGGSKPEHFRSMYAIADRKLSAETVKQIDEMSCGFVYRRFENQPIKEGAPI